MQLEAACRSKRGQAGSRDRAKDADPTSMGGRTWRRCTFGVNANGVPLLGCLSDTPSSSVRWKRGLESSLVLVAPDRPRLSFARHPAKGAALRKAGVPFTVSWRCF